MTKYDLGPLHEPNRTSRRTLNIVFTMIHTKKTFPRLSGEVHEPSHALLNRLNRSSAKLAVSFAPSHAPPHL